MTETTSQNTQDNKKDPPAAWYQKIGTVAQICSAIIAFVGFTGLMWQIHSNETNSRQASARQIYLEYTKAALEKPQYLEPDMKQLEARNQLKTYEVFVSNFLFAYDEVFQVIDDNQWRAAFKYDLPPHIPYLCGKKDETEFWAQFYPKTCRILGVEMKKANCEIIKCPTR